MLKILIITTVLVSVCLSQPLPDRYSGYNQNDARRQDQNSRRQNVDVKKGTGYTDDISPAVDGYIQAMKEKLLKEIIGMSVQLFRVEDGKNYELEENRENIATISAYFSPAEVLYDDVKENSKDIKNQDAEQTPTPNIYAPDDNLNDPIRTPKSHIPGDRSYVSEPIPQTSKSYIPTGNTNTSDPQPIPRVEEQRRPQEEEKESTPATKEYQHIMDNWFNKPSVEPKNVVPQLKHPQPEVPQQPSEDSPNSKRQIVLDEDKLLNLLQTLFGPDFFNRLLKRS